VDGGESEIAVSPTSFSAPQMPENLCAYPAVVSGGKQDQKACFVGAPYASRPFGTVACGQKDRAGAQHKGIVPKGRDSVDWNGSFPLLPGLFEFFDQQCCLRCSPLFAAPNSGTTTMGFKICQEQNRNTVLPPFE
jgi:hypothetical protein